MVRLGDEVTVKRCRLKGSEVWLLPENTGFQPIVADVNSAELALEGVVVGVIRNAFPTAKPA